MYDPFDARAARRAARAQRRYARRYYRYSNPLRGLAGGLFLIALIIGFAISDSWSGTGFLVLLFVGLAFASLFGSFSTLNPRGIYGGIHGFIWMLGLALCFAIGFWPWILLPVAVTMILGALFNPITMGLAGMGFLAATQMQQPQPQSYQQPYASQEQPGYQQGYQGTPAQPQQTYQEGGQQYSYDPQPKQEYEQPQAQHPEQQELPPMEQQQ
jgi:hypothetical protein